MADDGQQLFGKTISRRGQPDLVLHFAVIDGRPECVGIEVGALVQPEDVEDRQLWRLRPSRVLDGPLRPISAQQLRGLGLGEEVRKALREWSRNIRDLADDDFELPSGEPVPRSWRNEARKRLTLVQAEEGRPAGRPRLYDDEHFREVARVYLEGEALGRTPTAYVARMFSTSGHPVSKSSAAKWIAKARNELHFLPPTTKGRATKGTTKARRTAAKKKGN